MYKTMQALITDVEQALYQSAGPSVQLYSQDVVMSMIQDAFDHVFTKRWWPQFRKRELVTLDGTNGYPLTSPLYIKLYEDIRYVYAGNSQRPLPSLPLGVNVNAQGFNQGTTARWVEGDAGKVIRVWPNSTTDTIMLVGRSRPDPFVITDIVPLDALLIKHFAVWSYFVDDGSSPGSVAKHQGLFEARLQQMQDDNFNEPIVLDAMSDRIPTQWNEGRY